MQTEERSQGFRVEQTRPRPRIPASHPPAQPALTQSPALAADTPPMATMGSGAAAAATASRPPSPITSVSLVPVGPFVRWIGSTQGKEAVCVCTLVRWGPGTAALLP